MFQVYNKVNTLPAIWDEIVANSRNGANLFLTKNVLEKLEQLNPCGQQYHLNIEHQIAFVTYRMKLNVLTFTKFLSLKVPVNIIGVPISVAKAGYVIAKIASSDENMYANADDNFNKKLDVIVEYIKTLNGLSIIMNTEYSLNLAQGTSLPTCKMDIQWSSFEQYLKSMRSPYRYRVKKAISKFTEADISVEELIDNNQFNEAMYRLYEDVYQRSSEKLEKQSMEFFRKFPAKIITFLVAGEVIAFVQLVEDRDVLIFIFCGFAYRVNEQYGLYWNMLLHIIRYGIRTGAKSIDFGQTTEETKMKLGAIQHSKYLYIHHRNLVINAFLSKVVGSLSYEKYEIDHKVFRGEVS